VAARALPGDIQLRRTDDAGAWRVFRMTSPVGVTCEVPGNDWTEALDG
jgi:hypothetical protein